MSQDMPLDLRGFKGINLREPAGMIQDDELAECINLNIGRAGELSKRTGFATMHGGATLGTNDVQLLGHYITADHSQIIATTIQDKKLWYSTDGATWTEIIYGGTPAVPYVDLSISWNAEETGVAEPAVVETQVKFGVQYVNVFYMVSTTGVLTWDGEVLSTLPDTPSGSFCTVYKDRLYVLDSNAENNSRLYFSSIAEFETWPSTNFFDVYPGDGDFLTCCAVIQDLLIIFKTKTTAALYVQGAPENWLLRNVNPEIGCISKFTPREIEGFLFFVGPRGVYKTDGNLFENISESIDTLFDGRIVNLTTTNIDAAAWWDDRYIVLLHPTSSTYLYMVYHLRTGGWTEWQFSSGVQPAYFLEIISAQPGRGLYTGNRGTTGRVYKHGDGAFSDAGINFTCSFKSKEYDLAIPSLMKRGKWMAFDIDATGTVSIIHYTEGDAHDTLTFTAQGRRRNSKVPGPGYFRTWQVELQHTTNTDFMFYVMTLWMHKKRPVIGSHT